MSNAAPVPGPNEAGSTPLRRAFPWQSFGFWLPPAIGHAIVVAWLAVRLQEIWAPWLLFPFALGIAIAAGALWLARFCRLVSRPAIVAGTVLAALVAVWAGHYFSYLRACELAQQAAAQRRAALTSNQLRGLAGLAPQLARPAIPGSFAAYLADDARRGRPLAGAYVAQGALCWLSWALDAMLEVAGSLALLLVVIPRARIEPA